MEIFSELQARVSPRRLIFFGWYPFVGGFKGKPKGKPTSILRGALHMFYGQWCLNGTPCGSTVWYLECLMLLDTWELFAVGSFFHSMNPLQVLVLFVIGIACILPLPLMYSWQSRTFTCLWPRPHHAVVFDMGLSPNWEPQNGLLSAPGEVES